MKVKVMTILRLAGPKGMPETALRLEIEARYRIRVGEMEIASALGELAAGGFADHTVDMLTGDKFWKLTAAGETR